MGRQSRDDATLYRALLTLTSAGPQAYSAVPDLLNLLEEGRSVVGVTEVFAAIGEAAVPAIVESLKSQNSVVRYWSASNLPARSDTIPALFEALNEALVDDSACVRAEVARSLARFGSKAVPVLMKSAKDDSDPEVRSNAISALSQIGMHSKDVTELLLAASQDENFWVRLASMSAMRNPSFITDEGLFIPALVAGAGDQNPLVRESVAVALGTVRSNNGSQTQSVLTALRRLEEDPVQPVRYWAKVGIQKRGMRPNQPKTKPKVLKWPQEWLQRAICPERE
jgi:HEAT repeat protein